MLEFELSNTLSEVFTHTYTHTLCYLNLPFQARQFQNCPKQLKSLDKEDSINSFMFYFPFYLLQNMYYDSFLPQNKVP